MKDTERVTEPQNHLIIHGHFYQPPRENPWINIIERQDSAHPFHDWNERITAECYRPNSMSRILGDRNRIIDIVNNYKSISFNVGPTLMSWLSRTAPEVYAAIVQADKKSCQLHSGHGNAIAQAYHHMILPLANRRDVRTQIRWGLEDFKYHFGRESESIWLPETAINSETIAVLIEMGIRYIILSPYQALRVRRLSSAAKWTDVSHGSIDINMAYRCYDIEADGRKSADKFIDIFFYHADLSRAVAFEHLLRNAGRFADSIQEVYQKSTHQENLVTICTDGESYGHHEPFGDMALAYLSNIEAASRHFRLTNFGEFLEKHPPRYEVELKSGPGGEGTSWSCFHGVGRWYRDCGCSAGATGGWNQKWRWSLRQALDYLRDKLAVIFADLGRNYFLDPWLARDNYIRVLNDRSEASLHEFWRINCFTHLSPQEKSLCLKLLEMQSNAMRMYTSCGWFFADISGIETVQILKYAARAIDLAADFCDEPVEADFLEILKGAHSNIKQMGNGRDIYNSYVVASKVSFQRIAAIYAINSFSADEAELRDTSLYMYRIMSEDHQKVMTLIGEMRIGKIAIICESTDETRHFAYLSRRRNDISFDTYVKELDHSSFSYDQALRLIIENANSEDLMALITSSWGNERFTQNDIPFDAKVDLYNKLLIGRNVSLREQYLDIYARNKHVIFDMKDTGVDIPYEFALLAEYSLNHLIGRVAIEYGQNNDPDPLFKLMDELDRLSLPVNSKKLTPIFQGLMETKTEDLANALELSTCKQVLLLKEMSDRLCLPVQETRIQNAIFSILDEKLPALLSSMDPDNVRPDSHALIQSLILLAYNFNFEINHFKKKLKFVDTRQPEKPELWP